MKREMIDVPSLRPYPAGTLVAVTGIDPNVIRMIGRVVVDRGDEIKVESDVDIESDAAIEYDFPTPEQRCYVVRPERVRLIVE